MLWLMNQIMNLSWKFLGIAVCITLLKNCRETIIMWIKVKSIEIQKRLFKKYEELKQENKES